MIQLTQAEYDALIAKPKKAFVVNIERPYYDGGDTAVLIVHGTQAEAEKIARELTVWCRDLYAKMDNGWTDPALSYAEHNQLWNARTALWDDAKTKIPYGAAIDECNLQDDLDVQELPFVDGSARNDTEDEL